MSNTDEILKKILLHMKYDSKNTLSENYQHILNEDTSKCRNYWWYDIEKTYCWKGKDPVSCSLRKILKKYDLAIASCDVIGQVWCGKVWISQMCAFGSGGEAKINPYIKDNRKISKQYREETIAISPTNTLGRSNIIVRIFKERKNIIPQLNKLLGKGFTQTYVPTPIIKKDKYSKVNQEDKRKEIDNSEGTIEWGRIVSDDIVSQVCGILKGNTTIPFYIPTGKGEPQKVTTPKYIRLKDVIAKDYRYLPTDKKWVYVKKDGVWYASKDKGVNWVSLKGNKEATDKLDKGAVETPNSAETISGDSGVGNKEGSGVGNEEVPAPGDSGFSVKEFILTAILNK